MPKERKKKNLDEIIETMIKYRNKPKNKSLSRVENLLCLYAYFSQKGLFSQREKV